MLDAPVKRLARPSDVGVAPPYFLEFELADTPPGARVLFADDDLLMRGIRVPEEFRAAILRVAAA